MSKNLDYRLKRIEKGPLQRFKNQNAVLKKFGETGLKLYKAINGKKTAEEIVKELGFESDFVAEVIAWLEEKEIIELIIVEDKKEKEKIELEDKEKSKESTEKSPTEEKKLASEFISEPDEKKKTDEIEIPKLKSRLREIIEQETKEKKDEISLRKLREEKEEEHEIKEDEIVPIDEEEVLPIKEKEIEFEYKQKEEQEESEKEEIIPIEEKEELIPESEDFEKPEEEKIEPRLDKESDEISPETKNGDESEFNSVEKTITEKYGELGFKVYSLIDGQKTAEEIMSETGINEAKLIEMLEFMEKQGIIKLEHPETKVAAKTETSMDKFAPLSDNTLTTSLKEICPVELPTKVKINILTEIQLKANIALKFGENGSKIINAIDGKTTDIDLSIKFKIPLYEVRNLLLFLALNKMITIQQLDRNEVSKKYGEDCFVIYKKYGREGVLLYELIGKDLGIKQIFQLITKEKEKFTEIFIFVHKVLGIDLPIDRDVIYSQLEEKK